MIKNPDKTDVLIVGAGPIGLACGIEARRRNLTHLIIEKGCLVNSIFHYPTNMTFFSTSDRLEIGDVPFISHGNKPTRLEALEYYRRVAGSWDLKVNIYEKVEGVDGKAMDYIVRTNKREYPARIVIVATGYYDNPNLLNVPGEELPKVRHYYNEPHPYACQNVAVIGAGNSAVDVALELYRVGAHVILIVRESGLKEGIKYWVRPDIENRIREGSIAAHFESVVTAISEKEIEFRTSEGTRRIPNDFVFAMTGYHPDFDFLKTVGIEISGDQYLTPLYDELTFESVRAGVYLAGVVCGGMETSRLFIENSREHAMAIFDDITEKYIILNNS
ncbi:MAG: YpdA family putative bacillithiol disulfide reductase [Calditrichaeota bacterium]|nr:MAG: YpdA family putative bacillithiol disulfide reductase [Calditrichota bacterium]